MVTGIPSPPGLVRSRATISGEISTPSTRTPRAASGSAIRPVPTASSSAGPPSASFFRNATAAFSSPRGSSSYSLATSSPKLMMGSKSFTDPLAALAPPYDVQQVLFAVERVVVWSRPKRGLAGDGLVAGDREVALEQAFAAGQRRQL